MRDRQEPPLSDTRSRPTPPHQIGDPYLITRTPYAAAPHPAQWAEDSETYPLVRLSLCYSPSVAGSKRSVKSKSRDAPDVEKKRLKKNAREQRR
jgi:hypothetical protein